MWKSKQLIKKSLSSSIERKGRVGLPHFLWEPFFTKQFIGSTLTEVKNELTELGNFSSSPTGQRVLNFHRLYCGPAGLNCCSVQYYYTQKTMFVNEYKDDRTPVGLDGRETTVRSCWQQLCMHWGARRVYHSVALLTGSGPPFCPHIPPTDV